MKDLPGVLAERMQTRRQLDLWRTLSGHCGIDFTSNDYLGFALDPDLRRQFDAQAKHHALTASGSRLLRGELEIYSETEKVCAAFSGKPAALFYPSGYQANLGLFSALLTPSDHVFSDELNHASIIDGIKLSGAKKHIYPHRNLLELEALLLSTAELPGLKLIVSESIFSMDGSAAPLLEIFALAKKHGASIVIDEAHATGLWGAGLVQSLRLTDQVLATTHTGGKALGASGAWVACNDDLRNYLIQFSRGFIYSTAPFPLQALLLKLSIEHWQKVGKIRAKHLLGKVSEFQTKIRSTVFAETPYFLTEVNAPIIPIIIGETAKTLEIARSLQEKGFDVRAIRPPTVAEGSSRLRIILHWQNTEFEKENLIHALGNLFKTRNTV